MGAQDTAFVERIAAQVAEQRAYIERHFRDNDPGGMNSGVSIGDVEALLTIARATPSSNTGDAQAEGAAR